MDSINELYSLHQFHAPICVHARHPVDSCDLHHSQDKESLSQGLLRHSYGPRHSLPLATPNLLSISIVLSFQECYVNGIIYYVIFKD